MRRRRPRTVLVDARRPSSPRSMTSWRICAWPKRAPRCWRSPTRCRPTMSGASGRKPCSTMTTSSSRRRTCCRAPMRPPGCCTRSTAASTTSWSTRRRTPTPRNGASSRLWRRSSLPARAQATSCARCSPSAMRSSRSTPSKAPNPARFGEVGRAFRRRAEALGLVWHEVPLTLSFRSTEPILEAVDSVFGRAPAADGLTWQAGAIIQHDPFRKGEAGLVELWEVETEEKTEPRPTPSSPGTRSRPAPARSISSASASPP